MTASNLNPLRRHLTALGTTPEQYLMPDHVQMLLAIPPKYAVSQMVGYIKGIKGKGAIHLARVYGERKRGFVGQSFNSPPALGRPIASA